jgi:hypothetical protein
MNESDLRDCFAMFALVGLLKIEGEFNSQAVSELAYTIADSMLEARKPKEDGIVSIKKRGVKK